MAVGNASTCRAQKFDLARTKHESVMADFSRFLTAAAAHAVSNDAGDHNFGAHQLLAPPPSSSSMPPLLTPSQIQSSQVTGICLVCHTLSPLMFHVNGGQYDLPHFETS